jgi:penicillin-binding protein 1A
MFEPIIEAAWKVHAPKTALRGPSPEAMRQLFTLSIDPYTGDPAPAGSGYAFTEYLKRDASGRATVSRAEIYGRHGGGYDGGAFQQWSYDSHLYDDNRSLSPFRPWRPVPREYPSWNRYPDDEDRLPRPPRRVDPDYFWRRLQ